MVATILIPLMRCVFLERRHRVTVVSLQKDARGAICLYSRQRKPVQMAAFEPALQSPKGNFFLIYLSSNGCLSPIYQMV